MFSSVESVRVITKIIYLSHQEVHQKDRPQEDGQFSPEYQDGSSRDEYEDVSPGPQPGGEADQDRDQGQRVGERAGAVEHEVELRDGEEGEEDRHRHSVSLPYCGPVEREGRHDEAAEDSSHDQLLAELGAAGQCGEGSEGGGEAGEDEGGQESPGNNSGEGQVVVLTQVRPVGQQVVDGLQVETLLHLGEGAGRDVEEDRQEQEDTQNMFQTPTSQTTSTTIRVWSLRLGSLGVGRHFYKLSSSAGQSGLMSRCCCGSV